MDKCYLLKANQSKNWKLFPIYNYMKKMVRVMNLACSL